MVEGYTDVLAMHQCGIENVVANSGTALNEAQIHLLHRFTENITLIYDGDEAGIHAATRSTDMLLAEGLNVKILFLPDGDDPDSFSRKHNATEFKQYVSEHQTDFILFKVNLLLKDAQRDPIKRAELTENIIKSIAVIPDEIVRSVYVHECAELLNADESMLMRSANKNRAAILENLKKEAQRERDRQRFMQEREKRADQAASEGESNEQKPQNATEEQGNDAPYEFPPLDPEDFPPHNAPQENQVPQAPKIVSFKSQAEEHFIGIERMIMSLVARYGEKPIDGVDEEGNPMQISLLEYVHNDLKFDNIQFHSSLYARMLSELMSHNQEEGFKADRYLLSNPDIEISKEAVELVSDKYQLSSGNQMTQSEEELKVTYISRLLLDYKYTILDTELKESSRLLTLPEVKNDPERFMQIMKQNMEGGKILREIAKRLGDRVLTK